MVEFAVKSDKSNTANPGREAAVLFAVEQLKNENAKLSDTVVRQERLIKMLRDALYGQKSERIVDIDERQGVFEEILNEVDELNPEAVSEENPEEVQAETPNKSRRKRRSLKELIPENLPREQVVIDLPEENEFGRYQTQAHWRGSC